MKNILKTTITILMALGASGCEHFLEENPSTALFSTQVYANEENAYTGVIGCYGMLTTTNYMGTAWTEIMPPSSIFVTTGLDVNSTTLGGTQKNIVEMARYAYNGNNSGIEQMFNGVYALIVRANDVIYGIEHSKGISEEAKNRLTGEVKFLRAFSYFNIVRTWGKAPLLLTPPTSIEEAHQPRSGVKEIFDQIIKDFEFAEQYMPTKEEQAVGKPFNYAATAFLAKVYAHMATSEYMFEGETDPYTENDRKEFWRKAYTYAKKVYDDKKYELVPRYGDLWQCRSQNTSESIFEIQFNFEVGYNDWGFSIIPSQSTYTPEATTGSNATRIRPTKVPYEWQREKYTTYDNMNIPVAVDPRIAETYVVDSYQKNSLASSPGSTVWVYPNEAVGGTGERFPVPIKFVDPTWKNSGKSNMNWIVYRYADLLLTLAEAANEIGDPDNIKFTAVNEVLARARQSTTPAQDQPDDWSVNEYPSQEEFRDAIMKERLFELPLEGHEWFDVRRRGKAWFKKMAEEYNQGVLDYEIPGDQANGIDRRIFVPTDDNTIRKLLFMPLPYSELNNNRALTLEDQNYGY